ncbi:MAG: sulfatase [Polyangia bacterium]
MKRVVFALLLCACSKPAPHATAPVVAKSVYRLVDEVASARVDGDLDAGLRALSYPLVSPSPLPPGADGAWPRAMQVAFAEPDLDRLLGRAPKPITPQKKAPNVDLTWNSTQGVYEAREALFLPDGVAMHFQLPPSGAARLTAQVAGLDAAALTVALADGVPVHFPAPPRHWQPMVLDVPPHAQPLEITLRQTGKGPVFVGAPVVRKVERTTRPNILFVLVDTLRQDALVAMPRLRTFAGRGAQFTTAITAATWTRPSLLAMFGGDLPSELGHAAEDMIPTERERRRFRAVRPPLLPRRLAELGYETRAIGNNFFLLGFPRIGLDLGLDSVTDVRHLVLDTPAITDEAIRALSEPHEAPQLLYLHYDAPHWPYTPPPAAMARAARLSLPGTDATRDPDVRRYLGEAAYIDGALGDLFDALDRSGHSADTIVVVVGDHGEIFDPAHAFFVEALGQPTLHHHGWSAYDELLRVPLVIVWPGHIVPRVVEAQTSLVDLAPTLSALVGLPPLEQRSPTQGRSMAAALEGHDGTWLPERPAFAEGQDIRALRDHGWLYLQRRDGRLRHGTVSTVVPEELYDLATDPLQHVDRHADASQLATMRTTFAALAPLLPAFAEPVVHLALAPAARDHVVEGEVRCECTIWLRALDRARAGPVARKTGSAVQLEISAGGRVDLVVDPPDAPLELQLREDGTPLDGRRVLIGPIALPLLDAQRDGILRFDAAHLSWLDATRPPELGNDGALVMWRDPVSLSSSASTTTAADSEVATMMQRWGYAQQPAPAP